MQQGLRKAQAYQWYVETFRDLCKTLPFAQFRRQAQISSLEILNVFLHLKFSPSLNLNKIDHFSKVSSQVLDAQEIGAGRVKNR